MKIQILCSDLNHPNYNRLERWADERRPDDDILLVDQLSSLTDGDFLFLISCSVYIKKEIRECFGHALVVHASAVPEGRGWSPHVWQILQGKSVIPVTLLEADDSIDTGSVWACENLILEGHELCDEINEKLFAITARLMNFAIDHVDEIEPRKQAAGPASYFPKRTPSDSLLDPDRSIADQFDLLRIADPIRFPCFFSYRGCTYTLTIKKRESK